MLMKYEYYSRKIFHCKTICPNQGLFYMQLLVTIYRKVSCIEDTWLHYFKDKRLFFTFSISVDDYLLHGYGCLKRYPAEFAHVIC